MAKRMAVLDLASRKKVEKIANLNIYLGMVPYKYENLEREMGESYEMK